MKRWWLAPLLPVYGAVVAWKNARWDKGVGVRWLQRPVVSVGSLSAGGAGKTPVVMALAELLRERGVAANILSRGYGRREGSVACVDAGGSASEFGDEPLLMARRGVPVYVGPERFDAGVMAEREGNARLHLLDDGFQHRRLGRGLDVVLLTKADVEDALLPAGNLREPLRSLRRASVVVVREEEWSELMPVIAKYAAQAKAWGIRRKLVVEKIEDRKLFGFCGIARPNDFFRSLEMAGVRLGGTRAFRDHHLYSEDDLRELRALAAAMGCDGLVTTQKDAVKLRGAEDVLVARLDVEWVDADACWTVLQEVVG